RQFVHQVRAGRSRHAVDPVVGGHDGGRVALLDHALELLEVVLAQRPFIHVGRSGGAVVLAVVGGEVLERGAGLEVTAGFGTELPVQVLAFHPVDVLGGDAGGQHRVLAVHLVVAPPPRVPAQVHRRRVEVQVQQVVPHDFASFAGDLVSG